MSTTTEKRNEGRWRRFLRKLFAPSPNQVWYYSEDGPFQQQLKRERWAMQQEQAWQEKQKRQKAIERQRRNA